MEFIEEQDSTSLTEKDIQEILTSLSDDLIFDSLKDQINHAFTLTDSTPVFYLTFFTGKYDFLINKYANYDELVDQIKEVRETFFTDLQGLLEEKFGFVIEFQEGITEEDRYLNLSHIYNFFVIRNKENITRVLFTYIENNMNDLVKYYKPLIDKKDLTYTNMKKTINKDATVIICKLPEIIQNIEITNSKDMMNLLLEDDNEITTMIIRELFLDNNVISFEDDFVTNYLKAIKKEEIYYLLARTHLMNKYSEKK